MMETLQFNCCRCCSYQLSSFSVSANNSFNSKKNNTISTTAHKTFKPSKHYVRGKIRAAGTSLPEKQSEETTTTASSHESSETPPSVNFAFVHSVLLPDGTPDVHYRRACGGQKLRDIMLDSNIELYGPNARPLLNCAGGGTCATCIVEVVQGKELLNPRTDKEEEKLKRHPKNWRLACQTTVGTPDSRGLIVIQQLPEWKGHEWNYTNTPLQTPE